MALPPFQVALAGHLAFRSPLARMRLRLVEALALETDRVDESLVLGIRELVRNGRHQAFDQRDALGEGELVDGSHQLPQSRMIHPLGFLARCHLSSPWDRGSTAN